MYSGNGRWVDVKDLANVPGIGRIYGVVEVE
jgi:DNA uptake protein ComE-like DNA-binding protein